MPPRAFVFTARPGDAYRIGRSLRSLHQAGLSATPLEPARSSALREILASGEPALFLRAGAWLTQRGPVALPPASSTGKGVCAIGRLRRPPISDHATEDACLRWNRLFEQTGGDFGTIEGTPQELPDLVCLYLDSRAASALSHLESLDFASLIRRASPDLRLVHFPPLDAFDDPGLRVLQIITALHRGGAERLTLDLVETLPQWGVRCRLATCGRPGRRSFEMPPGTLDLTQFPGSSSARLQRLQAEAVRFGADVLHAHLLPADILQPLSHTGIPLLVTLHNARQGWPRGTQDLTRNDVALIAGCSIAVANEAIASRLQPPVRPVWNGIRTEHFRGDPNATLRALELRRQWGFGPDDLVLLSLANPRPQKRLDRMPAVVAATRVLVGKSPQPSRPVRWVIAGESLQTPVNDSADDASIQAEIQRHQIASGVRWAGTVEDVQALLAAANVLVSVSAYEGLSLAHLEALAAERPVVATQVGGAAEVAQHHPRLYLVPPDAPPEVVAQTLVQSLEAWRTDSTPPSPRLLESFTTVTMSRRYRTLYPRAIARRCLHRPGRGLWLVINNFSTGGAQTSARRLLLALRDRGEIVRAAVLQEDPDDPTPGCRNLRNAGVRVLALPPVGSVEPDAAVEPLLEAIDLDPPAAVFFWNVIPIYKILLADALLDIPVFDVSPGEMFFDSLDRYFETPRTGVPYLSPSDYGARLAGVVVKHSAEVDRARAVLGAPVWLIHNGIPTESFPAAQFAAASGAPATLKLGTLARLSPQKRIEDLLVALRIALPSLPEVRLDIVGGVESGAESYVDGLESDAADLPVTWRGETLDPATALHEFDLFLMISEPAGCPNALLEAMACGLPVLATAVGGASDLIEHGVSGWLVPPRDAHALAEALIQLAREPALRIRLGAAARRRMETEFSLERMADNYQALIRGDPHLDGSHANWKPYGR